MTAAVSAGHKRFRRVAVSARPFAAFLEARAACFVLVLQTFFVMFHSMHVFPMVILLLTLLQKGRFCHNAII